MADGSVSPSYEGSIAQLQATLKWLVGSAGAIGAIIVGGLQLRDLPGWPSQWWPGRVRFLICIAAVALTLAVSVALLVATSRLLTRNRRSVSQLSDREIELGIDPMALTMGSVGDKILDALYARRTVFLDGQPTVTAYIATAYTRPQSLLSELAAGKTIRWKGRDVESGTAEGSAASTDLENAIVVGRQGFASLESAAYLWELQDSFAQLVGRRFVQAAALFITSILAFSIATMPHPAKTEITTPLNVRVVVTDRTQAESVLPSTCHATQLNGVAVGGELQDPIVETFPVAGCPAQTVHNSNGLQVIPLVSK